MSVFDTILFDSPINCKNCGRPIDRCQTKLFGSQLTDYRVGDLVEGCPVLTGVVRETLICDNCHASDQLVFFTVWHTLLTGIYEDRDEAESKADGIDRATLIDYLERHQRVAKYWQNRFGRLESELEAYHDYLKAKPQVSAEQAAKDMRYFRIADYVLKDDPLAALIESNQPSEPEQVSIVGEEAERPA